MYIRILYTVVVARSHRTLTAPQPQSLSPIFSLITLSPPPIRQPSPPAPILPPTHTHHAHTLQVCCRASGPEAEFLRRWPATPTHPWLCLP